MLTQMPPPTYKKGQSFLGVINYLGKFLPSKAEVHDALRKLTSAQCDWTWNNTTRIYNKAKGIINKNAAVAFFSEKEQLYMKTDALGVGL